MQGFLRIFLKIFLDGRVQLQSNLVLSVFKYFKESCSVLFIFLYLKDLFYFFSSLSHHRKRHAGVIHQTPRVITQQTITSANGEQAVIVTTGGDEDIDDNVDSEDEAAAAAAALTGRATLGRATHLLADGGIVFEVHNE